MVGDVMVEEIGVGFVVETAVGGNVDSVAEHSET